MADPASGSGAVVGTATLTTAMAFMPLGVSLDTISNSAFSNTSGLHFSGSYLINL